MTPRWIRVTLVLAGIYNLLWGAVVLAAPMLVFDLTGAERPRYPQIWQCVGMIVGVYGIGYLCAARDPRRHWPIVLVGLLGKVFGPVGFVIALRDGVFPASFAWTILTNDLVWWVPFSMILWHAARSHGMPEQTPVPLDQALRETVSSEGVSVLEASQQSPMLLVLLRHAGCTFCKEALADVSRQRDRIERQGVRIAFVHMGDDLEMRERLVQIGLDSALSFPDPQRLLYRALELRRGSVAQLFGIRVFVWGVAATLRGHVAGKLEGDGFQMPGAFLIHRGRIERAFRHNSAADRPDYPGLACPAPSPSRAAT